MSRNYISQANHIRMRLGRAIIQIGYALQWQDQASQRRQIEEAIRELEEVINMMPREQEKT